jgi:DNA repair exonuclease SbcCD ATPase subunit
MSKMYLQSIRLEQFLQYQSETRINDLDEGLCVIAGSNEAGKSTLLKAIRACFFDRYKSGTARRFRPYNADVSPKVAMTFSVSDVEYSLKKTFSTKKEGEAVLEFTGGNGKERKEGDEAEEYLARLLNFVIPSGASKIEQQGLAGLLWVDQAKAFEAVDLTDSSRRRVQSVFEHEMRDLLGGESGDAIHQTITGMWGEYFGKNGPIGSYRKLFEKLAGLSLEVEEKKNALKEYEDKVDQLESRQQNLQAYVDDDALATSRKRLEETRKAVQQIEGLRLAVSDAKSQAELNESKLRLTEGSYTARNRTIEDLRRGEQEGKGLDQRSADVALKLKSAEQVSLIESKLLSSLKQAQAKKDGLFILAAQLDELAELASQLTVWNKRLEDVHRVDQQRREAVANRDRISLAESDLKDLRVIQYQADMAQAKMESAATGLTYELNSGVAATLGEEAILADGSALLSEPTSLAIDNVGTFMIKPGGEELELHRAALIDNRNKLGQKLAEHGLETVELAEAKWQDKRNFAATAELHRATLDGMAPNGMSAIEDQVITLQAKITDLQTKLGETQSLDLDIDALAGEITELKEKILAQEDTVRSCTDLVNQLREEASAFNALKAENVRQLESSRRILEQARAEIGDDELLTAYTLSKAALDQVAAQLKEASAALDAENPEILESELERAERFAKDIAREIEDLTQVIRDLKIELSALGQKGLSEEVAEAEGVLALAQLEFDMADKQAKALDLLKRALDEALTSAKKVAARPITTKLIPYLRQLMPDANPVVNENMVLVGIERAGTHEPFEELSMGTREQLAVLIRLAYADLLSEADQPVTVILDDALVNSDDERREQMKAILYQASKRYQIIILTCHGREYRDAGGQFIRLEDATV